MDFLVFLIPLEIFPWEEISISVALVYLDAAHPPTCSLAESTRVYRGVSIHILSMSWEIRPWICVNTSWQVSLSTHNSSYSLSDTALAILHLLSLSNIPTTMDPWVPSFQILTLSGQWSSCAPGHMVESWGAQINCRVSFPKLCSCLPSHAPALPLLCVY